MLGWIIVFDAAQSWAAWPGSRTPRIFIPPRASASIVSSTPDDPANVKIANTVSVWPLSICFISSSSGV